MIGSSRNVNKSDKAPSIRKGYTLDKSVVKSQVCL